MRPAALFAALLTGVMAAQAQASPHRSAAARAEFMRAHPCPANGHTHGACPGYIVDHVKPLCANGADHQSNMQWQTVADAKAKDKEERKLCKK